MPKRVIDADAMWSSDKLAACAEWAQAEYAWLYGLADASGSFELTNLRVIWGRVAAIRRNFSIERLEQVFEEFGAHGLLFRWEASGKRYGHWTGSDVPGRLPAPSWRVRLEKLAPPVPRKELQEYLARFSSGVKQNCERDFSAAGDFVPSLKPGLERAQAQDLDWDRKKNQTGNGDGNARAQIPPSTSRKTSEYQNHNRNQSLQDETLGEAYREDLERAMARAAQSLDPWASRTEDFATGQKGVSGNGASRAGVSGSGAPQRLAAARSYATGAPWQSRREAKATQLARDLALGRGPQLPPRRAAPDAPDKKVGAEKKAVASGE